MWTFLLCYAPERARNNKWGLCYSRKLYIQVCLTLDTLGKNAFILSIKIDTREQHKILLLISPWFQNKQFCIIVLFVFLYYFVNLHQLSWKISRTHIFSINWNAFKIQNSTIYNYFFSKPTVILMMVVSLLSMCSAWLKSGNLEGASLTPLHLSGFLLDLIICYNFLSAGSQFDNTSTVNTPSTTKWRNTL